MTRNKLLFSGIISAALSVSALFSSAALGNDLELVSTTIPASACRPTNDDADALLRLRNGGFMFRQNETGVASLLCPLPLNGWRVSLDHFNQFFDGPRMDMSSYRIYYRDENSCSSENGVRARLRYRRTTGHTSTNASPWWNSWSTPENPPGICVLANPNPTTRQIPLEHPLRENRLYHFLVEIRRDSTAVNPVFTGIDFPSEEFHIPQ